jgi:hypothetical protein
MKSGGNKKMTSKELMEMRDKIVEMAEQNLCKDDGLASYAWNAAHALHVLASRLAEESK